MHPDDFAPFAAIHGTAERLLEEVDQIRKLALYVHQQVNQRTPIRLLSASSHQGDDPQREIQLECSFIEGNTPYIAISYTWQRPEDTPSLVPRYCINRQGHSIRPSKELCYVLYRAFEFAKNQSIHAIWIDQLCIDQADPNDIEKYLHFMDEIYAEAACVFVPMTLTLDYAAKQDLQGFIEAAPRFDPVNVTIEDLTYIQNALRRVRADPWFSRAWTFLERYFAQRLFLSFLEGPVLLGGQGKETILTSEHATQIRSAVASASPDLVDAYEGLLLTIGYNFDVRRFVPDTSLAETTARVYGMLHECGLSILEDKLSILAGILGYEYRLLTTKLQSCTVSFSACLLVLLLSNMTNDVQTSGREPRPFFYAVNMDASILKIFAAYLNYPNDLKGPTLEVVDEERKSELRGLGRYAFIPYPLLGYPSTTIATMKRNSS